MQVGVRQPRIRAILHRLLRAGLSAVDPAEALHRHVRRTGNILDIGAHRYDLRGRRRVVAVGAGKASARMAAALEAILKDRLDEGLIVVKYGHAVPTRAIEVLEAGHPIPDQAGRRTAARLLTLVQGLAEQDLLLVLLSGGASSLLPAPVPGLTLMDKQRTTDLLLRSGATIQEINTVRKHLSAIKGGRLAASTKATVVCLILSDVIGDDLGTIGSGPTAPDPTTDADARNILYRYGLWGSAPVRVRSYLLRARRGHRDTPKPGAAVFRHVQNQIIGNNRAAVDAVALAAARAGLHPLVLSTSITGEAKETAKLFGAMARELVVSDRPVKGPACVIAGGELTVTMQGRGKGLGGRAQEFALAAAGEITGLSNVWIAAFGTDGTDGPTDAAGAVVDGGTADRAARLGLDQALALRRHDSYTFFKRLKGHIVTGPTGTNVNDLYLLLAL